MMNQAIKTNLSYLLPIILLIPTILLGQEVTNALGAVEANSLVVEQLAAQLGISVSPFIGVFLTSLASHLHYGSEFIQESPIFGSTLMLIVTGLLTATSIVFSFISDPIPLLKPIHNFITGPLQQKSMGVITVMAHVGAYIGKDVSAESDVVIAGTAFPFALIFTLFVALSFFIMVTTVTIMIDLMILVIPIPFIDTILEVIKYSITFGLVVIGVFFPKVALVILGLMYVGAWLLFKRAKRAMLRQRILLIDPMLEGFRWTKNWSLRSKAQKMELGDLIFPIFLSKKRKPFSRQQIIFISFDHDEIELIQPSTLFKKAKRDTVSVTQIENSFTRCKFYNQEEEIGYTSTKFKEELAKLIVVVDNEEEETNINQLLLRG